MSLTVGNVTFQAHQVSVKAARTLRRFGGIFCSTAIETEGLAKLAKFSSALISETSPLHQLLKKHVCPLLDTVDVFKRWHPWFHGEFLNSSKPGWQVQFAGLIAVTAYRTIGLVVYLAKYGVLELASISAKIGRIPVVGSAFRNLPTLNWPMLNILGCGGLIIDCASNWYILWNQENIAQRAAAPETPPQAPVSVVPASRPAEVPVSVVVDMPSSRPVPPRSASLPAVSSASRSSRPPFTRDATILFDDLPVDESPDSLSLSLSPISEKSVEEQPNLPLKKTEDKPKDKPKVKPIDLLSSTPLSDRIAMRKFIRNMWLMQEQLMARHLHSSYLGGGSALGDLYTASIKVQYDKDLNKLHSMLSHLKASPVNVSVPPKDTDPFTEKELVAFRAIYDEQQKSGIKFKAGRIDLALGGVDKVLPTSLDLLATSSARIGRWNKVMKEAPSNQEEAIKISRISKAISFEARRWESITSKDEIEKGKPYAAVVSNISKIAIIVLADFAAEWLKIGIAGALVSWTPFMWWFGFIVGTTALFKVMYGKSEMPAPKIDKVGTEMEAIQETMAALYLHHIEDVKNKGDAGDGKEN